MTSNRKDIQNPEGGKFKVFEFIAEMFGWLRIVSSPLLIGLIIGAIMYFPNPTTTGLVAGILMAIMGLVVGIIWATKVWRSKGTMSFLSRILSTPELDKSEEVSKSKSTVSGRKKRIR